MNLALFFSMDSVKFWNDTGLLYREKIIYEEYLRSGMYNKIYWFTYGVQDTDLANSLKKEGKLAEKIEVIGMNKLWSKSFVLLLLYSLMLPFIMYKYKKHVDVIRTNQMRGAWTALIAQIVWKKPLVIRTGYTWSKFLAKIGKSSLKIKIVRLIERTSLKCCDVYIVTSEDDKRYLIENYGNENALKISIVVNYVDTNVFKPLYMNKLNNRMLYVGRLTEQKNVFNMLQAIKKSGLGLDIYGIGELQELIEIFVKNNEIDVRFMGILHNDLLPEIMNRYDYYILVSYFEGMPKTLIEAMACGLICIGSEVEGINELLANMQNGIIATNTDCDSIFDAIMAAVNIGKEKQKQISENARKYIVDKMSLDMVLEREKIILSNILTRRHDARNIHYRTLFV
jgi:glycosyltransferase involved in cell wall biosynthesis